MCFGLCPLANVLITIRRFMPPGTEHFIVTLDDSLCFGGHFYCVDTMISSVKSMMQQHCLICVSNTEQEKNLVLILQMTCVLFHDLEKYGHRKVFEFAPRF